MNLEKNITDAGVEHDSRNASRKQLKAKSITVCQIRYGNKTRTQQVCNLFNAKYLNNPITQSTVNKIEFKFRETGDVKDLPKSGRPKITQDKKIDIVLSMEENPQSTSILVASENEVSQTTVLCILRKENYHPYKFQLVQELNEDDPDRRLQFCETMMDLYQTNPNLHQQILVSDEATFCLNCTVTRQNCRVTN
ncbi:hypothetical protein NQ318_023265 [Aromia moschata]|uniref:DUF4817 domain-containing protein n=1 Tax=Aromia moschata TaxID=1265417 RepID=A0AAV8Y3R7_9CUCU|nr:hypothetical protein NQ318_023265 [Aromia moschata]